MLGVLREVAKTHTGSHKTEVVDMHYFRVILAYFQRPRNATLG